MCTPVQKQLLDNLQDFVAVADPAAGTAASTLPRIQVRESRTEAFQVLRAEQAIMSMRAKAKKRSNSRLALS
jgi:hypothetical protein